MHSPVVLLLHGFLIRRMLMSHCNGRPRGLFLFQFGAFLPLYCAFTYLGSDWWQQRFDTALGSLHYRHIIPIPVWNMGVYCLSLIGRGDFIFNPLHSFNPSSHPCRFPFIRPHSVGPRRSAAAANLIKLTTIKIRLNYCKAVHWHPRSILNLKKKKEKMDSLMRLMPTMGSWVKRDKLGCGAPRLFCSPVSTKTLQYFLIV